MSNDQAGAIKDTNRAEPMKACANCLRPQCEHNGKLCPRPYTTHWQPWDYAAAQPTYPEYAELEATRLPLAGAATSDPTLKQPEVVNPMAEWPWRAASAWVGHVEAVYKAVRETPYGANVPVAVLDEMRHILLASPAPSDAAKITYPMTDSARDALIEVLLLDRKIQRKIEAFDAPSDAARLPTAPAGAREAMQKVFDLLVIAWNDKDRARDSVGEAIQTIRAALAAAPGARQPLSENHIMRIAEGTCTEFRQVERVRYGFSAMHLWNFARAIEAEHGISLAEPKP